MWLRSRPVAPAPPPARSAAVGGDGGMLRPRRPVGPPDDVRHRVGPGLRGCRRRHPHYVRLPLALADAARHRAGAGGRVRQLPAAGRQADWLAFGPAAGVVQHGSGADPGAGSGRGRRGPARRLGRLRAGRRAHVRPRARLAGLDRAGRGDLPRLAARRRVRDAAGAHRRGPGLSPVHAVPAGPPAGAHGAADDRRAARRRLDRARGRGHGAGRRRPGGRRRAGRGRAGVGRTARCRGPVAAGGVPRPGRPADQPGQQAVLRGRRRRARPAGRARRHSPGSRRLHRALRAEGPMSRRRPTGGSPMTEVQIDPETLRAIIARELIGARQRTCMLTDSVDEADLVRQHSPLMSPLVWDLAHIANQEELWLLREVGGREPMHPEIDPLYDAFEHPRSERPTLPLLPPAEARAYGHEVRGRVLDLLDRAPFSGTRLLGNGFAFGMIAQHEVQHDETMLITHQIRAGAPVLAAPAPGPAPADAFRLPSEVLVPGGPFTMGTSTEPWALDNERPAHTVQVAPFYLDTTPVTCGAYAQFIDDGGYDDRRWWTRAGWEHRQKAGLTAPLYWRREGRQWTRRVVGRQEPITPDEPVVDVAWDA